MLTRLISLAAVTGLILGLVLWTKYTIAYTKIGSDFTQDYIAATALREGTSIYGENIVQLARKRLGFDEHENYHPPTTALLFLPFTYLSYPTAVILWNLLNVVFYLATILLIFNTLALKQTHKLPVIGISFLWFPFISNIGLVQISLLLVYLVVLAWKFSREDRGIAAGLALGIATLLKLFPGYLGLYFVLTRNFRALAALTATVSCGLIASYLLVGHNDFMTYVLVKMPEDSERFATFLLNGSLPSVVSSILSVNEWTAPLIHTDAHQLIGIAFGIGLTLFTIFKLVKSTSATPDDAFAMLTIAMLLVCPITWIHVMPLTLLPIAVLTIKDSKDRVIQLRLALLALMLFSIPDVPLANYLHNSFLPERVPWSVAIATKFTFIGLALLYWASLLGISDKNFPSGSALKKSNLD